MVVPGEQLVKLTRESFVDPRPGSRAAHSNGVGVVGSFVPGDSIAQWCVAPQFNTGSVPVLARFSNGSGAGAEHDNHVDARGLAVKFFRDTDEECDMVAMTLQTFFVSHAESFGALAEASTPIPVADQRQTWLQRTRDRLALRAPAPPVPPDVDRVLCGHQLVEFSSGHPEAKTTVGQLSGLINPKSYGRATYHGVHTFMITDPNGAVRPIRYRWSPQLGSRGESDPVRQFERPPTYLRDDLAERLERGDVLKFTLEFIFGEAGDPLYDPTQIWHIQRRRLNVGELRVEGLVADQEADSEKVSFNPGRLVDGFGPSPDPLLAARARAYLAGAVERGAHGRVFEPWDEPAVEAN